jgi:hypothetical protein
MSRGYDLRSTTKVPLPLRSSLPSSSSSSPSRRTRHAPVFSPPRADATASRAPLEDEFITEAKAEKKRLDVAITRAEERRDKYEDGSELWLVFNEEVRDLRAERGRINDQIAEREKQATARALEAAEEKAVEAARETQAAEREKQATARAREVAAEKEIEAAAASARVLQLRQEVSSRKTTSTHSSAPASRVSPVYLKDLEDVSPLGVKRVSDAEVAGWILKVRADVYLKPEVLGRDARYVADPAKVPFCTHDAFRVTLVDPLLERLLQEEGCEHLPFELGGGERLFSLENVFLTGVRGKVVEGVNARPDCVVEFKGHPLTAVEYKKWDVKIDKYRAQEGLNLIGALVASPHLSTMMGFLSNGSEYQFVQAVRTRHGRFTVAYSLVYTILPTSSVNSPEVESVVGGLKMWRSSIEVNKEVVVSKLTPTDGSGTAGGSRKGSWAGGGSRGGPNPSGAGPSQGGRGGFSQGRRGGGAGGAPPSKGSIKDGSDPRDRKKNASDGGSSRNGASDGSKGKENAGADPFKRVLVWPPLLENMTGRVEMTPEERVATFLNKN